MGKTPTSSPLIAHLLRRAGFGTTPKELEFYNQLGYEKSVKRLTEPEKVKNVALEALIADQNFDFTNIADLKRWWLFRMCFTERPLEEKMTLFWHGHFATSINKVDNTYAMYLQNLLMRKLALGNFGDLLLGISKDPAMIQWLDNQQNRKGSPNENYAREVMELFTLGIGHYTERDIKEAARAFTGWQARNGYFFFNDKQHDFGNKTVLANSGNLNGQDIVGILVKEPATGVFLAHKLIAFFVSDNPDPSMVRDIASVYHDSHGDMRSVMQAIFLHPHFISDKALHAKIKSPAEMVVGTVKTLQVNKLDADLPAVMSRMGQSLFQPPNVKGWDGGRAWISTNTMMERFNFAGRITQRKFDSLEGYISPSQLIANQNLTDADELVDYFLNLLTDNDVSKITRQSLVSYVSSGLSDGESANLQDNKLLDMKLRGLVHLIMTLPAYQLA
jgi:uncharacterized protein (DUF1800 family)